jgi:Tfp pilus assembly protein PilF
MKIADGVITTSQFVKPVYFAAYADHGYNNKEELVATKVNFFFEQGRSNLRTSELRSERGKNLNAFIADKNVTRTVTITGTHSPEGPERINKNLSSDRAKAIETYYRAQMKRYDYKNMADEVKFILKPVVEDWDEFSKKLEEYQGITQDQKNEWNRIIKGGGSFEEKEKRLQQLSTYKKVFNDIYPELRAAKTEILTVKPKKTDAEISVLASQITKEEASADALSLQELLYAATLTPSLTEKKEIYKSATKKEGSWVAHNNLGAVYLEMAIAAEGTDRASNVEKAITQLELSVKQKESAEAHANLGSAYLLQGNTEKAEAAINKASSMTMSSENERGVNGVKGAIQIKNGKYQDALTSLANAAETNDNLFNRGLAQLLKGDAANAANTFAEIAGNTKAYGDAHYMAAVANARLKKDSEVFNSLKSAVRISPNYAEKALNDLEFANYSANEAFRSALR